MNAKKDITHIGNSDQSSEYWYLVPYCTSIKYDVNELYIIYYGAIYNKKQIEDIKREMATSQAANSKDLKKLIMVILKAKK
jgi:hypothetical protein